MAKLATDFLISADRALVCLVRADTTRKELTDFVGQIAPPASRTQIGHCRDKKVKANTHQHPIHDTRTVGNS